MRKRIVYVPTVGRKTRDTLQPSDLATRIGMKKSIEMSWGDHIEDDHCSERFAHWFICRSV